MHDSHFSKNPSLIGLYPDDLPASPQDCLDKINALIKTVFSVMAPFITKYPEAKNAYDLYGLDVMLTDDGIPKLLEVNRFPSFLSGDAFRNKRVNVDTWKHELFDTVVLTAVADVFGTDAINIPTSNMVTEIVLST